MTHKGGTVHIKLRVLDKSYNEAVCGEVFQSSPIVDIPRYGFLDWKTGVNCQGCLRTAWKIMREKGTNAKR